MKKDAYYFSHDTNAQSDEKCLEIIAQYGMAGYGIYWSIIERMHESSDGRLNQKLLSGLAFSLRVEIDLLYQFYNTAIAIGLFVTDGTFYWSARVLKNKQLLDQKREKRVNAGKAGMQSRWHSNNNVIAVDNKAITKHNKVKESKVKEIIEYTSEIVSFLNSATGKEFKPDSKKTQTLVAARMAEGWGLEDFKKVISGRVEKWRDDFKMVDFLRPETLFGNKFESYLPAKQIPQQQTEKIDFHSYVNGDSN